MSGGHDTSSGDDRPAAERYREVLAELTSHGMPAGDVAVVERFILAGEGKPDSVAARIAKHHGWITVTRLPRPDRLQDEDRRAVQLILKLDGETAFGRWLGEQVGEEPEGLDLHKPVAEMLRAAGVSEAKIVELCGWSPHETSAGRLNSVGRYLLGVDPSLLVALAASGVGALPPAPAPQPGRRATGA